MKPVLKAPGTKRLELKDDTLLSIWLQFCFNFASNFVFNLKLRRYAWAQGKLSDARLYYEQAIDIGERTLGEDHPQLATRLANLGALMARAATLQELLIST